jgi:hypothetical protein
MADDCAAVSGINDWQGKPEYSEKTCSSAALSTKNPTLFYNVEYFARPTPYSRLMLYS